MGMRAQSAEAWRGQLARHLPRGKAWAIVTGALLDRLLGGLAEEFARADARIDQLVDEAIPSDTLELLVDWERNAGLPDSCAGISDVIEDRHRALVQRLTSRGGQSVPYFTDLAAALGYPITIEEPQPAEIGDDIGVTCGGDDWRHVWIVHVSFAGELPSYAVAEIGDDIGVLLRSWGIFDIECLFRRLAPAHSIVLFSYED